MASVPWVKNSCVVSCDLLLQKLGRDLHLRLEDEIHKWLLVNGSVVREKAMPVKVALKIVSEGQKYNI
jgi:hypothetical protein